MKTYITVSDTLQPAKYAGPVTTIATWLPANLRENWGSEGGQTGTDLLDGMITALLCNGPDDRATAESLAMILGLELTFKNWAPVQPNVVTVSNRAWGFNYLQMDRDACEPPPVGTIGYLIRSEFEGSKRDEFDLLPEPGRTNQSREPRVRGWLGTTDNVAVYAMGKFRVTSIGARRTRLVELVGE